LQSFNIPIINDSYSLALYIHIPFCSKKCSYCNFFSVPLTDESIVKKVLDETLVQGKYFLSKLDSTSIKTIYIGGGTPSLINRPTLDRFIKALTSMVGSAVEEWTIEANPESLDEDFIDICKNNGITRISLGLQSLDTNCLRYIGRNADADDNKRAVKLLREAWSGNLNVDLIAGIPSQTSESLKRDIGFILQELDPGHISFYSLTIEEGTELERFIRIRKKKMLSQSIQDSLWIKGYRQLEELGYKNYEISNFSRPGKECSHNMRYWRMDPYLGIGPGAVSTLPAQGGRVVRLENNHSFDSFLASRECGWNMNQEFITPSEFLLENIMMGFRLKEGIERIVFESRFGIGLDLILGNIWNKWEKKHFVEASKTHYRLTQKARLLLDSLLYDCAEYLVASGYSVRDVKWPDEC